MTRLQRFAMVVPLVLALLATAACADTATDTEVAAPATGATERAVATSAESTATTAAPTSTPVPTITPEPTATATLTPTPRPTNTPTPSPTASPTPAPTNTPTSVPPTATPTPPPQPVVYTGNGADVISIQKPGDPDDAVLVYVRGNAESRHFAVESFDASGQQLDLLVNTTDPYEGVVPLDFRSGEQTTRLQVTASGEWYIEIRPLSSARRVSIPGTISGNGDDVFIIDGDPDVAHIRGNAAGRHFAVLGYGSRSSLLVNTTEPYDGRVILAADTVVIEVNAEGGWEIIFE